MLSNFKNKRKRNPWKGFLLYAGAFFLIFLTIVLTVNDIRIYQKRKEFLTQTENLQNQIKDIQATNDNLNQGISESDNSQYIEKVAREQLDLQKPGEQAVSFVIPPDSAPKNDAQQKNNWTAWLQNAFNSILGK